MKILMVSIFSSHFINWAEQLKGSGHDIYWFDLFDSNVEVQQIDFVHHIKGWRFKWDFKGRYFLKNKAPELNRLVNLVNERKLTEVLEKKIAEIRPDVVHSFVIYLAGVPILPVMKKFPEIKWIISTWGSDLYYYKDLADYQSGIKAVLPKIDYLFTDCKRDLNIAREYGFEGEFLGVFPGGGGLDLNYLEKYIVNIEKRNTILIKGYQGKHGKCIQVLRAISNLRSELSNFKVIVFGAPEEVFNYIGTSGISKWPNLQCFKKIPREKVLELMGESLLYIGNSSSDGMPNTLLEAIIMGAFPIQSNPGGATEEYIHNGKNGFLIRDPENSKEIAEKIKNALQSPTLIFKAVNYNNEVIRPKLERNRIRKQVIEQYGRVQSQI